MKTRPIFFPGTDAPGLFHKLIAILVVICIAGTTVRAQSSHLSKKITLNAKEVSLADALVRIGNSGGFYFSYDASLVQGSKQVSVKATNTPVRTVLNGIIGNEVRVREIGNHVILIPGVRDAQKNQDHQVIRVSGYIRDFETRTPLNNVTVFEVARHANALSRPDGTYFLELPEGQGLTGITFCKEGYRDTVVFLRPSADLKRDIVMLPLTRGLDPLSSRSPELFVPGIDTSRLIRWLVPSKARIHSKNMQVLRYSTFHVSLIPFIGTNGKVTGSVANRVSFNLFAGYTRGTDGFELGGFLNINRTFLRGFQLGGFGNIVGYEATGFQLGGLFNVDLGTFRGAQIGGLFNVLSDTLTGAQIGGIFNITGSTNRGAQVAGMVNYARYNKGMQLAGLVNINRKTNEGTQVAGLLNYTNRLKGFQLGLFNVVQNVESGVPVGFLSIVLKNGYFRAEASADEIFYGNLGIRVGTDRFYNIFKTGIGADYMMNFTYGIGTRFQAGKKTALCLDLTTGVVTSTQTGIKYHGLLEKFTPTLDISLGRRTAIFLGPAASLYWFNKDNAIKPDGISFYTIIDESFSDTSPHRLQFWIGGVIGIKI